MKFLVPVLLFATAFRTSAVESKSHPLVHEVRAENDPKSTKWIFHIGRTEIRDTDQLKAFAAKLPAGSILRWDTGCIGFHTFPLRGPALQLADFRTYCKERKVEFDYRCGW